MKRWGAFAVLLLLSSPSWAIYSKTGGGGGGSVAPGTYIENRNTLQAGASFYVRNGKIDAGDAADYALQLLNDGTVFPTANALLGMTNTAACADGNMVGWDFNARGRFGISNFGSMFAQAVDASCGGFSEDSDFIFLVKQNAQKAELFRIRGASRDIHIGIGASGIDYAITVDGQDNDGKITFMEDEDRWDFTEAIEATAMTIGGDSVCQENGTNCPASSGGAGDNLGTHLATMTVTIPSPFGLNTATAVVTSSSTFFGAMLSSNTFGGSYSLALYPQQNYAVNDQGAGAIYLDNTLNSGVGMNIYTNQASAAGLGVPLRIHADNTSFAQPLLHLVQDGTSGGAANIRADGPAPQIEWVEADQATPAGKYEDGVNGDIRYFAGRNLADSSFQIDINYARRDASGGGYLALASTQTPLRFGDADNSNYISLRASNTVASNVNFVLPAADGTSGQALVTNGSGVFSLTTISSVAANSIGSEQISANSVDISADTNLAAGRSLTLSGDSVEADAELYTDAKTIWFENPTGSDDFKTVWVAPVAVTITGISCESDQTVNFDLQVDDGSATGVNGSDIACTSTFATDSSLAGDTTMAAGDRLDLAIASVSGTPTWVSITFSFTKDD